MKKFVAVLLSLLLLLGFAFLAWWLYSNFHSTPVLIANLLLVLTGVLLSITAYLKLSEDESKMIVILDEDYPEIESGIIYAQVDDFASKFEKKEGELFIIGLDKKGSNHNLENVAYNKLTDELKLTFKPSLNIAIKGAATIGIGDNQFLIFGFDTAVIKEKDTSLMDWKSNRLLLSKNNQKPTRIKFPAQQPTMIFSWT
jgi:hypothetical protein